MAKQLINLGTMADNKSGDPLRTAFTKVNENFDELYARPFGAGQLEVAEIVHGQANGVPVSMSAVGTGLQYGTTYSYGNTTIFVDVVDGAPVVTIQKKGDGRTQGETFVIPGDSFGGTTPENDVTVTVDEVINYTGPVEIDLTKQVHVLQPGNYHLADGVEGQIVYFVPTEGLYLNSWDTFVMIDNCLYNDTPVNSDNVWWSPFHQQDNSWTGKHIAMAIFANGAWSVHGGAFD